MEENQMPELEIIIEIEESAVTIKLPSVAGFIDMERRKIAISGNTHNNMLMGVTNSSVSAYRYVSMIANLEVLIPNINERLRVTSLSALQPHKIAALAKVYEDKIYPWLESWQKYLNTPTEVEDVVKENRESLTEPEEKEQLLSED